ncbi:MAG TPA: hypothetical protein VM529_18555 [Gemmata sp.]|nr:hypothetical protein [Gemmata sp.]
MADDFDDACGGMPPQLPGGFRAAVTHALAVMGLVVAAWEADGVKVRCPARGGEQYVGLANLYRRAKARDRAEWPALVSEFLGHISGSLAGPTLPGDLMTVAGQLRPRLGKPVARGGRCRPWAVPLDETGLEVNLVIDYPHTMAYVTEEMLARTNREGEDLLDLALANLRAATPLGYLERVSDELDIHVGQVGDGYDATRALLVEDLMPESPAGFWVVVPSREDLAVWPVSFPALEKIHAIKLYAQDNYRGHAHPVTDEVFWLWRGVWHPFGIDVDEHNVTISPPDEFLNALRCV